MNRLRTVLWIAATAGAVATGGCLQLETTIKMNDDGSAVVTERLCFSRRLLDMAKGEKGLPPLESLLTKEAAIERSKFMGKGVTVVSHELRDGEKGSRESLTVYKAEDITQFVYTSPFLVDGARAGVRFDIRPQLEFSWQGPATGQLNVGVGPTSVSTPGSKTNAKPAPIVRSDAPLDVQAIRDLVPVFADMLDDVHLRLRLECYDTVRLALGLAHRGSAARVNYVDLIDFSGKHMDQYGYLILHNEEVMREVLIGRLSNDRYNTTNYAPFLTDALRSMTDNAALPLFHQWGGGRIMIQPSLPLFKKYLEGKTLDWTGTLNPEIKARGKKLADFKEVNGWTKPTVEYKPVVVDNCPADCPWCQGVDKNK